MTFDEWMLIRDVTYYPTDDTVAIRKLRECWYHRDAEVESLRQQLAEKIELNNQLADFLGEAEQQIADSQKREAMLRGALKDAHESIGDDVESYETSKRRIEALAATDDLKDVRLCHAEPVAWIDGGDLRELGNGNDRQYSLWCENQDRMVPFYRAWEPK